MNDRHTHHLATLQLNQQIFVMGAWKAAILQQAVGGYVVYPGNVDGH